MHKEVWTNVVKHGKFSVCYVAVPWSDGDGKGEGGLKLKKLVEKIREDGIGLTPNPPSCILFQNISFLTNI